MLGTRTILGLAIDEFGIVAAEVSARSGRPEIRQMGQLTFEDKLTSDNVKDLAQRLKQFLRTNHFSSKQAVIGIPLKWVVAKEVVAPPANAETVASMLGIQAERAFSLNASELIFDYYGSTSASESSRVMLLAARRQIVEQIKEFAVEAGLQPRAMTVSALALGSARSQSGSQQRYGLYARPMYCEFWSQSNGRLQTIQHVPIASSNGSAGDHTEQLTSAIQRQVMLTSQRDQAPPFEVTLYDASGLSASGIDRLSKELKPQITLADGRGAFLRDVSVSADASEQSRSVAAAAVAIAAIGAPGPAVDFLNPRIGVKKVSHRKKVVTWGALIGAACVILVGSVIVDWRLKVSDIKADTAKLEELKPTIEKAQQEVDRVSYAASWLSQQPRFLECLKQLSQAFPLNSSIWATNFSLNEAGEGVLVGKAVDETTALTVIKSIEGNPFFSGVHRLYFRPAKEGAEFSVNFNFKPKGGK